MTGGRPPDSDEQPPIEQPVAGGPGGTGFDAEDFAPFPRRHGRGRRTVALVAAVSLLVFTVGTTIGVLVAGSGGHAGSGIETGPASVVPLGANGVPLPGAGGGRRGTVVVREARVTFTVANTTDRSVVPVCTVEVVGPGGDLGSASVHGDRDIAPGTEVTAEVDVPLANPATAARIGRATATCGA
jgi:hypothetical protein